MSLNTAASRFLLKIKVVFIYLYMKLQIYNIMLKIKIKYLSYFQHFHSVFKHFQTRQACEKQHKLNENKLISLQCTTVWFSSILRTNSWDCINLIHNSVTWHDVTRNVSVIQRLNLTRFACCQRRRFVSLGASSSRIEILYELV